MALVSDDGFAHVVKVEDLKNTASKCQLCRIIYTNYAAPATKQLGNTHLRLKVYPPLAPPTIDSSLEVTGLSLNAAGETEAEGLRLSVVVPLGELKPYVVSSVDVQWTER